MNNTNETQYQRRERERKHKDMIDRFKHMEFVRSQAEKRGIERTAETEIISFYRCLTGSDLRTALYDLKKLNII